MVKAAMVAEYLGIYVDVYVIGKIDLFWHARQRADVDSSFSSLNLSLPTPLNEM